MKSKLIAGSLLIMSSYVFVSCEKIKGSGPVEKQERTVGTFTGIATELDGTTYVTQESPNKLVIEAQQNILDIIESPVIDGKLVVRFKKGKRVGGHDPIVVRVSAAVIRSLALSGSGDLVVTNDINAADLSLHVSGSGELKAKQLTVTNKLQASISGSGNLFALGGTAETASYSISGSGGIDLLPLWVKKVQADISGSGNIKTRVSESLDVRISGSGNVWYDGNPTITTKISGSGNVRKAQ